MAKILIAIPTYDKKIDVELLTTIPQLPAKYPHHDIGVTFIAGSIIQNSRNYLCKVFLERGFDWLYFWDADLVIHDLTFLEKLLDTAHTLNAQVVGGVYRIKAPGQKTSVTRYLDSSRTPLKSENYKLGELKTPQLVDCIATGSMLIKRQVLETIPDPWFEFQDFKNLGVWPEDYTFCDKAHQYGFKVAVDPRFNTYHWGYASWTFSPEDLVDPQ